MSRSRRQRSGLWIATFSDGTSTRIVARSEKSALKRALDWCSKQGNGVAVSVLHEVI